MAKVTCVLDGLPSLRIACTLGKPNNIHDYHVKEEGGLFYVSFDTGNIFEPHDEECLREEMEFRLGIYSGSLKNIIYEK